MKKYDLLNIILVKYQKVNFNSRFIVKLRHVLKIIHNFNKKKKYIWFIGFNSLKFINKITLKSNHLFLPENFWLQGLVVNKKFVKFKSKLKNYRTPDLVIIFGNTSKLSEIITELCKQDIPVILFGSLPKLFLKSYYSEVVFIENFSKKVKSFIFFLIYSVLKKF